MIWAAAAMGLYNSVLLPELPQQLAKLQKVCLVLWRNHRNPRCDCSSNHIRRYSLRSCRLMVADYLHIDQKTRKNRVLVTLGIFIPVILILVFAK